MNNLPFSLVPHGSLVVWWLCAGKNMWNNWQRMVLFEMKQHHVLQYTTAFIKENPHGSLKLLWILLKGFNKGEYAEAKNKSL